MGRVLVIQKDKKSIAISKKVFKELGLEAVFVENLSQLDSAIKIKEYFDLILYDVDDTSEITNTCSIIKNEESIKHTPVIFVKNKTDYIEKRFLSGANDYLIKPFSESELLTKIKTYLRLKAFENNKHSKQLKKHILEFKTKTLKNSVEIKNAFLMFEQELDAKNKQIKTLEEKIKQQELKLYEMDKLNREIRMENSTLKQSIEKIKKNLAISKLQAEITRLKEENKELQEEIDRLNADLANKTEFMDIEDVEQELIKQKITRWHQRNR